MDLELEHVPGSYTHPNLSRKAGRDLVAPENRPEVERVSRKTETMNQALLGIEISLKQEI